LADRIAVVDHGRLVANDTASSLKARLARTVIEIGMENDQAGEQAEAVLSGPISPLVTAHPEREGALVRLASRDGSSVLVDVLRSLDSEGLAPATLSVREPSLDDVFLALTGRHAFDESAENAAPAPSGRDYNPAGGEERP
jgi:ABC-type multidrug transport system ATPase subunit